ncbi:TRAP transporter large permease subunit [uncultured Nisaea sp.]|mgnify:CR=1 FL=1|uniref:TRAP transporter large permease n=1 Tax=uncultured Nisaea sp. TaxID=538215 RepID=UPI0030EB445F|tara:strand:+ start:1258 stop:3921 length:2664 start_codon:yes stop_codon:yes gene_type:complete
MELVFLLLLVVIMATALASGFPVAFALPGSAIITIGLAALTGELFAGDAAAYFAQGGPVNWLTAGVTNFRGVYWEVERDTLIAIPLFVFMGIMLQRSKIAEDLLVSMAQLFGPIRGGLGISVVFVGALLAATTGIVGATVVAMGLISLPAMLRNNYSHSLATGTIAASGTLGQIIPPSIVLIILADQLSSAVDQAGMARTAYFKETTGEFTMPSSFGVNSTSAGDMFMGALLPGLVLVGLYMAYILIVAFFKPKIAPAVPFEGQYDRKFAARVLLSLVPPLTLIFVVLGSIITGIATVNQAGAIGAVGAMVMAGYRLFDGRKGAFYPAVMAMGSLVVILVLNSVHPINIRNIQTSADVMAVVIALVAVAMFLIAIIWSGIRTFHIENTLRDVMVETAKTSALVFIILLGAAMLTAAFRAFGGEELVREFLTGLPGGFWAQFIIVMGVIFILGFFLDFIEIAVVVVPIVAPILLADPSANITAVWLGVMIGMNIQTSFLTPPFGFALFYLRGVAPAAVKTLSMYKGVIPFISLQLFALFIVGITPQLVNYLPNRMSLTSESAPPPKNPRLQVCIEDYIQTAFAQNGNEIRAAIADAKGWDLSNLPKSVQNDLKKSFASAEQAFPALEEAFAATAAIDTAAVDYKPLHVSVRAIQRDIFKHAAEIKELEQTLASMKRQKDSKPGAIEKVLARIERLKAEKAALESEIPANWEPEHKTFTKILSTEKKARLSYRRTVDTAYEPIQMLRTTLQGTDALIALSGDIDALAQAVTDLEPKQAEEAIKEVESKIGAVPEAGSIRSALSKVRRALRGKTPDPEKALEELQEAKTLYAEEVSWRQAAQQSLSAKLATYDAAIKNNIGLRLQDRLPHEIALEVAACQSNHVDISLHF